MGKVFKDIKVGDIIYSTINCKDYEITAVEVIDIEQVTTEWHTYREWAYGEEEEYPIKCNKLIIKFNPIKKIGHTPPFDIVSKLEIDLGMPSYKHIPDGDKEIKYYDDIWFSNKAAIIKYYKDKLDNTREKIQNKLNELQESFIKYTKDKEKVNGYEIC